MWNSWHKYGCQGHCIFWIRQDQDRDFARYVITWDVTEILDRWAHPGCAEETLEKATLIKWWPLKVSGPRPGYSAEFGEFLVQVSFYGGPPGWRITVG
jgi:hypothetical protein